MDILSAVIGAAVAGLIGFGTTWFFQWQLLREQRAGQSQEWAEQRKFIAELVGRQQEHEKQMAMDLRNFLRTGRTGREGSG